MGVYAALAWVPCRPSCTGQWARSRRARFVAGSGGGCQQHRTEAGDRQRRAVGRWPLDAGLVHAAPGPQRVGVGRARAYWFV